MRIIYSFFILFLYTSVANADDLNFLIYSEASVYSSQDRMLEYNLYLKDREYYNKLDSYTNDWGHQVTVTGDPVAMTYDSGFDVFSGGQHGSNGYNGVSSYIAAADGVFSSYGIVSDYLHFDNVTSLDLNIRFRSEIVDDRDESDKNYYDYTSYKGIVTFAKEIDGGFEVYKEVKYNGETGGLLEHVEQATETFEPGDYRVRYAAYSEVSTYTNNNPTNYGLFVGATGIGFADMLDGESEAAAMRDRMIDEGMLQLQNTKFLTTADEVTGTDIKQSLEAFNMLPGDNVVIYLAGHGNTSDTALGETTVSPGDEYIITSSASGITDDHLTQALDEFQMINKFIYTPACHGGGFWGNGEEDGGDLETLSNILFSAGSTEDTVGYIDIFSGHSLYSGWLLYAFEMLDGKYLGDLDGDGSVSFKELADFAKLENEDWLAKYIGMNLPPVNYFDEPAVFSSDMWAVTTNENVNTGGLLQIQREAIDGTIIAPVPTPEPATFVLYGIGLLGVLLLRKRLTTSV